MLRKDTQKYQGILDGYVQGRCYYERACENLAKKQAELDKAKKHYDLLFSLDSDAVSLFNEDIKEWYGCYTSAQNMLIGFEKSSINNFKGQMERYGKVLTEDYGDDLDLVYEKYDKRYF